MSDLADFSRRLGQLEVELADARESGNEAYAAHLYHDRAAAWRAFAQIQRDAGRDHLAALGAAARDEAKAAELQNFDGVAKVSGRDPLAIAASLAAVVGLFIYPLVFGPIAVILGAASPRKGWRAWSALGLGLGEVVFYLYTVGVIHS